MYAYITKVTKGAVRRTAPVRKSFVQFAELHLSTVVNFRLANLTHKLESYGAIQVRLL